MPGYGVENGPLNFRRRAREISFDDGLETFFAEVFFFKGGDDRPNGLRYAVGEKDQGIAGEDRQGFLGVFLSGQESYNHPPGFQPFMASIGVKPPLTNSSSSPAFSP